MGIREAYAPIDIHDRDLKPDNLWPAAIPPLTWPEAKRAALRLFRFGMGTTFRGVVKETTGNRHTWIYRISGSQEFGISWEMTVNAEKGWRDLVHGLSHALVRLCNPGERPHSKFHARFEAKLVKEVIRRGWLSGVLVSGPEGQDAPRRARMRKEAHDPVALRQARIERRQAQVKRLERRIKALTTRLRTARRSLGALEQAQKRAGGAL